MEERPWEAASTLQTKSWVAWMQNSCLWIGAATGWIEVLVRTDLRIRVRRYSSRSLATWSFVSLSRYGSIYQPLSVMSEASEVRSAGKIRLVSTQISNFETRRILR
mmetsp:Transcript_27430/g.39744  ORF Transcript_27430/g.39744 Transcript_27430/m.39744 type:complete len:106 (+) Transcript_27430:1061-1378(+)